MSMRIVLKNMGPFGHKRHYGTPYFGVPKWGLRFGNNPCNHLPPTTSIPLNHNGSILGVSIFRAVGEFLIWGRGENPEESSPNVVPVKRYVPDMSGESWFIGT